MLRLSIPYVLVHPSNPGEVSGGETRNTMSSSFLRFNEYAA